MEIWGFLYFFLFSLLIFFVFSFIFSFFYLFFNFYFIFLTSLALCKKMTFSALYKTPTLRTPTLTSPALCKNKLDFPGIPTLLRSSFFLFFHFSTIFRKYLKRRAKRRTKEIAEAKR